MPNKRLPAQSGVTLMELLVVISVFGLLMTAVGSISQIGAMMYTDTFHRSAMGGDVRQSLQILRGDLQMLSGTDIIKMKRGKLVFRDLQKKRVSYTVKGKRLFRNSLKLTEHDTEISFEYLNSSRKPAKKAAQTVFVQLTLTMRFGDYEADYSELIYLRN